MCILMPRVFQDVRSELAFYIGCLNLYEQLQQNRHGMFSDSATFTKRHRSIRCMHVSLALQIKAQVIGNDFSADNQSLFIVTGANQGGKTTFLRSVGQAQLMMQCGMFVAAEAYSSHICKGVYTHFKKEEDTQMKSGRFDEELACMNDIANHLSAGALMLFNESFAATNDLQTTSMSYIYRMLPSFAPSALRLESAPSVSFRVSRSRPALGRICIKRFSAQKLNKISYHRCT